MQTRAVAVPTWAPRQRVLLALATLAVIASTALSARAATVGSWQPAPPPAVHRSSDHTATLLRDGRILVVGGLMVNPDVRSQAFSNGAYTSAEIFDPARGRWSGTGALAVARQYHTATLLADGRVLVVGGTIAGSDHVGLVKLAEVYDPASGSWSPAGSLAEGRFGHTATLLPDGRVLVVGGATLPSPGASAFAATASAEIFDPHTGRWSQTTPMPEGIGRWEHAATLLDDGTVLITGGHNSRAGGAGQYAAPSLADAVIYHPATAAWTLVPHLMSSPRSAHSSTLLADGSVLIAGGSVRQDDGGGGEPTASADVYVPRTGSFIPATSMLHGRIAPTATRLQDGTVLVVGGVGERGRNAQGASGLVEPVDSAELYSPATGRWTATAPMLVAVDTRHDRALRVWVLAGWHTATLLSGPGCGSMCGRVLVIGGDAAGAQQYIPDAGAAWTERLADPRILGAGAAVLVLLILVFAGWRIHAYRERNAW